ncbi:unnamed protein product [Ilex paraguariensis]|uniref:Uncharacterized protein n=1 Tax=Ilex paraguariensis TaxID=185542 RepID=A0ABC8UW80_9AQUA
MPHFKRILSESPSEDRPIKLIGLGVVLSLKGHRALDRYTTVHKAFVFIGNDTDWCYDGSNHHLSGVEHFCFLGDVEHMPSMFVSSRVWSICRISRLLRTERPEERQANQMISFGWHLRN